MSHIGTVDVVVRTVEGILPVESAPRRLYVDDSVYWQEKLITAEESATEVEFMDKTRLTMGPKAEVRLDSFVYDHRPEAQKMVITVLNGMTRFVTGKMHSEAYEVRAPGTIIGVRGTEFTVLVKADTGETKVVVHRGQVKVTSEEKDESILINPGWSGLVRPGDVEPLMQPAPAAEEDIESSEMLSTQIRRARAIQAIQQTQVQAPSESLVRREVNRETDFGVGRDPRLAPAHDETVFGSATTTDYLSYDGVSTHENTSNRDDASSHEEEIAVLSAPIERTTPTVDATTVKKALPTTAQSGCGKASGCFSEPLAANATSPIKP